MPRLAGSGRGMVGGGTDAHSTREWAAVWVAGRVCRAVRIRATVWGALTELQFRRVWPSPPRQRPYQWGGDSGRAVMRDLSRWLTSLMRRLAPPFALPCQDAGCHTLVRWPSRRTDEGRMYCRAHQPMYGPPATAEERHAVAVRPPPTIPARIAVQMGPGVEASVGLTSLHVGETLHRAAAQ
jgi:hypothetical protein